MLLLRSSSRTPSTPHPLADRLSRPPAEWVRESVTPRSSRLSVLCAGILIFLAAPVWAETVTVTGADGIAGPDGGVGEAGTDGGTAEDAVALSDSADPGNTATALGGVGGAGGVGGSGTPAGNGGAGGNGGLARAEATASASSGNGFAVAEARGGRGGAGGVAGADGVAVGGVGGRGGDASATGTATTGGFGASARATSFAGAGGFASGAGARGGDGGTATARTEARGVASAMARAVAYGGDGGGGALGADGGDGASVSLGSDSTLATVTEATGFLSYEQSARGGDGGQSLNAAAGNGGDADTLLSLDSATGASLQIDLESFAGDAGLASGEGLDGLAGNATSRANATLGGALRITTESRGGDASRIGTTNSTGQSGGNADSRATGVSTSSTEDVFISVRASAGSGGVGRGTGQRGGVGGTVTGFASGSTVAGGTGRTSVGLTITGGGGGAGVDGADAGSGADAFLEDAVQGAGSDVSLRQLVVGGGTGRIFSSGPEIVTQSRAGNATSLLEASNPVGDLSIASLAIGGSASATGARPGDALAAGVATASGDVSVFVSSTAGSPAAGGSAAGSSPALANIGAVRGDSTGAGDVEVRLEMNAGSGGSSSSVGGNGGDAVVVDAVDGNTAGLLTFRQSAVAGNGGRVSGTDPFAIGGFAGDATSELTRSKSAQRLFMSVSSEGGDAEDLRVFVAPAGGSAQSLVDGQNDAGEVVVEYSALGGGGSDSNRLGRDAGAGGDATSIARGSSAGNGNAVLVGLGFSSQTEGGRGGLAGSGLGVLGGGDGGRALTDAEGVAQGDSRVSVEANALGGRGGSRSTFAAGEARGGQGGAAEARARGFNAGSSSVDVLASAEGGIGGTHGARTNGGDGGEAIAIAYGESSGGGNVTVTARVVGGAGVHGGQSVDGRLENAVSGSTVGVLRLVQEATGGVGGAGGSAGSALSSLEFVDDDGGRLELESIARGGDQGTPGAAMASAAGTGRDDVFVTARAIGGNGGDVGVDGGQATLGPVSGISLAGGTVIVEGEAIGGRGIRASTRPPGQQGGAGADVVLDNVVDGQTTGVLQLIQRAVAGGGGGFEVGSLPGEAGDATSRLVRAASSSEFEAVVEAVGGRGGSQSQSSSPSPIPAPGSKGGTALAEATISNDSGLVRALVLARGGLGGSSSTSGTGGDGGTATARATASSAGDGNTVVVGGVGEFGALGGRADILAPYLRFGEAGNGGDADSRSIGTALGGSVVMVNDRAIGGEGFDGGNAISYAEGRNEGSEDVTVLAEAIGGDSIRPDGQGGTAAATARGSSTTGNVSVTTVAMGGESGEISLGAGPSIGIGIDAINTLSGSTAGQLTLMQIAIGGASNSADPLAGTAGAANSSIEATNEGGGALVLIAEATGGAGLEDYVSGGAATTSARGIGVGSSSVDVRATSRGGQGASIDNAPMLVGAGSGGMAIVESASGESAGGGAVRVRAEAFGGDSLRLGGNGGDAEIIDAVSGSTSGQLTLEQFARGGTGATGGKGTSRFDQSTTAAQVYVLSQTEGGRAQEAALFTNSQAGRGGDSESALRISNNGGSVEAYAKSVGGGGFSVDSGDTAMNGDGGNASVDAYARIAGDGNTLILGDLAGTARSGAIGGRAGFNRSSTDLGGGRGGNASSRSEGIADGNSFVQVYDVAVGALGRNSSVSAGDGGDASSIAIGRNAGIAAVEGEGIQGLVVIADARGGYGGQNSSGLPGAVRRGANGSAVANASGFSGPGDVAVTATTATGFQGVTIGLLSSETATARSEAMGVGGRGLVRAISTSNAGELGVSAFDTSAVAVVSVASLARAESSAGGSATSVFQSDLDAAAFVGGSHSRTGEWARVGLQLRGSQVGPNIILAAVAQIGSVELVADSLDGVFVSFLDTRIDDDLFSTVRFRIENAGELLLEQVFDRAEDARVFFGTVLDLGDYDDALMITGIDLQFTLLMDSTTQGARFGTYFAVGTVVVPEPGTGMLLVMGLILMARRSRGDH